MQWLCQEIPAHTGVAPFLFFLSTFKYLPHSTFSNIPPSYITHLYYSGDMINNHLKKKPDT